jgi:hypothetical protein
MAEDKGIEIGYDDAIEDDQPDWTPLPEGEYPFRVTEFTFGEFVRSPTGTGKIEKCPKVTLKLEIGNEQQATVLDHRILLHSSCKGFAIQFLRAVGLLDKGGKSVERPWVKTPNLTGRCKLKVRYFDRADGSKGSANDVASFLPAPAGMASFPSDSFPPTEIPEASTGTAGKAAW